MPIEAETPRAEGEVEARIVVDADRVRRAIDSADDLPAAADNLIRSMLHTVTAMRPGIVRRLREIEESR